MPKENFSHLVCLLLFALCLGSSVAERDLENPCSEFIDGLLPYCVNLHLDSTDKDCGVPYGVHTSRRDAHHHDAIHTKNSRNLKESSSHAVLSFSTDEYQSLDFFNPTYHKGAFSNGLGRKLHVSLTEGAARVDCPVSTTDMRLQLDGLVPGLDIWLAGDFLEVGDWHGRLQGPYKSENIMKSRGYTTFIPGSGAVVVVEGRGAENVYVSGTVCIFKQGERVMREHNVPRQAVAEIPMDFFPEKADMVERMPTPHFSEEEAERLRDAAPPKRVRRRSKDSGEEVHFNDEKDEDKEVAGMADGWFDPGFGSNSEEAENLGPQSRPYTPDDPNFCDGDDYPCSFFCDYNNDCTTNFECMRDDQLPYADVREVPEYAVAHISFVKTVDGQPRTYICSGGLLGQTLNHPPNTECGEDFIGTCSDGLYNNFESTRFLTSGHCISEQDVAETISAVFNYSLSCEQGVTGNCYDGDDRVDDSYNFACATVVDGANILASSFDDEFTFIANEAYWLPLGDFTILDITGDLPDKRCYFGYSTINHANNYGQELHRVSHPGGAPRAYSISRVSQSSDWYGGPLEFYGATDMEDFFASLHVNITGVGLSAVGPQGGSSGGILFNDYAQAVGTQTGWSFFWGLILEGSRYSYYHGSGINNFDLDPCQPNYIGPADVRFDNKWWYYCNQYVVVDGAFYAYFDFIEDELQELCCPPFAGDSSNGILPTTKIDFSILPDGTLVVPPYGSKSGAVGIESDWSDWGITISTQKPGEGNSWRSSHPPQLFNSTNPYRTYFGAPNAYYDGPGVGSGGSAGVGANSKREGWVVVVSNVNNPSKPDAVSTGGAIVFLFANPVPLEFVEVINIALNQIDGFIEATDDQGVITHLPILAYGANSYFRGEFNLVDIVNITVFFEGRGAVSAITFCDASTPPLNAVGNYVWLDTNANGVQDVYEPDGVPGVVVQLHAAATGTGTNQRLAETVTDENGYYQFTSLNDGEYVVSFYVDDDLAFFDKYKNFLTGYQGWDFSPYLSGSDPATDSNAIAQTSNRAITGTISLSGGVVDNTWDAGIILDATGEVCIPLTGNPSRNTRKVVQKRSGSQKEFDPNNKKMRMGYKPNRAEKAAKKAAKKASK